MRKEIMKNISYKSKTIFKKWLKNNQNRFNCKLISNNFEGYNFDGIIKNISLIIDYTQPEAMLKLDDINTNKNYDYYTIQYIGNLQYDNKKGYYDADRVDKKFTYYNSFEELIIAEVFEPIIEYCNTNFREENSLYLIDYGGSTEGFIATNNEKDIKKIQKLKFYTNKSVKYLKHNLLLQS